MAFPTETVYGLGADVFDAAAVAKIFEAKQRPPDNPLIAHIGELRQLETLVVDVPMHAAKLIEAFFPGPLTIVLQKTASVPPVATAGLHTIGVRMPSDPLAGEFLRLCERPVGAPSANLSGRPSPTTWQAVREDLDGRIDCILTGTPTEIGLESTVVDCTSEIPVLLRKGAVSIEKLREVVPQLVELDTEPDGAPRSPGLKHLHYSPRAKVVVVSGAPPDSTESDAFIGPSDPTGKFLLKKICVDIDDYARSLFEFFRECDRAGVSRIFCEEVTDLGLGAALMDRIRRSASGQDRSG